MNFSPRDNPYVAEFTQWSPGKEPLLQSANLFTSRSKQAQAALAAKLQRDSKDKAFLKRYGQMAAWRLGGDDALGFQIHADKLSRELKEALKADNKLSWEPRNRETYDTESGYIEVHPRVGEAVMSTLGIACAQGEGLDIVGDKRSGELHRCLLQKDLEGVYESWLGSGTNVDAPIDATGEELFEFILGIPGDLSTLSVDKLRQIAVEREAIDALVAALRERAAVIPTMDPGKDRDDAFKDAASELMKQWKSDRKNLRGFARAFFGKDSAKLTADFATKVADKTLTGLATGTLSGGWLGSIATGGIIGGGAGLIIGLVMHAGTTYHRLVQREKNSPYRFLTTLEDAGVVFQSEVAGAKER